MVDHYIDYVFYNYKGCLLILRVPKHVRTMGFFVLLRSGSMIKGIIHGITQHARAWEYGMGHTGMKSKPDGHWEIWITSLSFANRGYPCIISQRYDWTVLTF